MVRRKGDDIAARLEGLALGVIDDLLPRLKRDWTAQHVSKQLTRGVTGAGANYEEARGAESRADFVHKLRISCKELREAHYWLRLLRRSRHLSGNLDGARMNALVKEADELIAILTASAATARQG